MNLESVCILSERHFITSSLSPLQRDISSEALGKDMAERFQKIQPRPSHSSTYVGDHDMEAFFRHNLEMVKLIQDNAKLRKHRLVGDMIRGVHENVQPLNVCWKPFTLACKSSLLALLT
jgi:hypothetical protein